MKKIIFILSFVPILLFAQKTQTVTVKAATNILNVKVKSGQKITVKINGSEIYKTEADSVIVPPDERLLYLKDFSDWRIALNTAITENVPLQGDSFTIESDCLPDQHVPWDGYFTLQGTQSKPLIITCNFRQGIDRDTWALYLGNGNKVFKNVIFKMGRQADIRWGSAIAMGTEHTTYNVSFINCKWQGDFRYCFNSTQGHGTASFTDCDLYSYFNNIQFYSQLGSKDLILKNCTIKTDSSHCIYATPVNNYTLDDVVCMGSGKRAFDSRSDSLYPFEFTKQTFTNCSNAAGAVANDLQYGGGVNAPQWHLWGQGRASVVVDSCNIPGGSWQGNFIIKNSNITNSGGGTAIYGKADLDNCTGEITATDKLNLKNSNITVIAMDGADITATQSTIGFYNKFRPQYFKGSFNRCNIFGFDIEAEKSDVLFEGCTFDSQYKSIRIFGNGANDIKFIGNTYQIIKY